MPRVRDVEQLPPTVFQHHEIDKAPILGALLARTSCLMSAWARRLSPSERGITGRDLREPFLYHRRDERAVVQLATLVGSRDLAQSNPQALRVDRFFKES